MDHHEILYDDFLTLLEDLVTDNNLIFLNQDVRGRYTQSKSAGNRTGTMWLPMGCTLAQPGERD